MPIDLGAVVAGYRVERLIGRGGEATLFFARDEEAADAPVALKVFHDCQRVQSALNESRNIARLQHPNILSVRRMGLVDGALFIALAYAAGGTLRERVQRQGPVDAFDAVRWMRGVADALCLAHEAKIVHRDVHPGNVLLGADGRLLIADFGLSTMRRRKPGQVVGWPGVIAPEVWAGRGAGPAADVYGLGVCLHFAATGVDLVPSGIGLEAQRARHMAGQLDYAPTLPIAIDRLIRQMTRIAPDDRPTMRQVALRMANLGIRAPGGPLALQREWRCLGLRPAALPAVRQCAEAVLALIEGGSRSVLLVAEDTVWREVLLRAIRSRLLRAGLPPIDPLLVGPIPTGRPRAPVLFERLHGCASVAARGRLRDRMRAQPAQRFVWVADETRWRSLRDLASPGAIVRLGRPDLRNIDQLLVRQGGRQLAGARLSPDARLLVAERLRRGQSVDTLLKQAAIARATAGLSMVTTWCVASAERGVAPRRVGWPTPEMRARLAALRGESRRLESRSAS